MDINNSSPDNSQFPSTKKPYEKPAFRFEQVFVTSALSCGKLTTDTQGTCIAVPKSS
jgi:hypothetical protein